jgi:hypothetical protein
VSSLLIIDELVNPLCWQKMLGTDRLFAIAFASILLVVATDLEGISHPPFRILVGPCIRDSNFEPGLFDELDVSVRCFDVSTVNGRLETAQEAIDRTITTLSNWTPNVVVWTHPVPNFSTDVTFLS